MGGKSRRPCLKSACKDHVHNIHSVAMSTHFFRCLISSIFGFMPHLVMFKLVQVVAENYIDPNDEESWIITLIKHALNGVPVQLNMSKLWIIQHVCCEGLDSPHKNICIYK